MDQGVKVHPSGANNPHFQQHLGDLSHHQGSFHEESLQGFGFCSSGCGCCHCLQVVVERVLQVGPLSRLDKLFCLLFLKLAPFQGRLEVDLVERFVDQKFSYVFFILFCFLGKFFTESLFKHLFPRSKWYPKPKHHQLIHIFLSIHQVWVSKRVEILRSFSQTPSTVFFRLVEFFSIIVPVVLNYGQAIR